MFERGELRDVARALLAEADRLDAGEAAGELPDFLQPVSPQPPDTLQGGNGASVPVPSSSNGAGFADSFTFGKAIAP
jgi:hypothetical protein